MFVVIALRDLEFRRRRFLVAVIAVGLVFGIALLLSGLSGAFRNESRRVVGALGADSWIVAEGTPGPFNSGRLLPAEVEADLAALPGVEAVSPLLVSRGVVDDVERVNLLGLRFDGQHLPTLTEGRTPEAPYEVVADSSLSGPGLGDTFQLSGETWTIVGRTSGQRFFAGVPVLFARADDVQATLLEGAPVVNAFLLDGEPASLPPGLGAIEPDAIAADLDRPIENPIETIDMIRTLLWLVAAGIIGTIVYLTVIERVRDFAVLKATGASTASLLGGLFLQAGLIAIIASVIAVIVAQVLAPVFPMAVEIPGSAYLTLPLVALVIAGLASIVGVRRVLAVDPALAFGA